MWKIYKYPIPVVTDFEIAMPSSSTILKIDSQHGSPQMWVLVQPDSVTTTRHFIVFGTGHAIPGGPLHLSSSGITIQYKHGSLRYIDTFQRDSGRLIWHLFEVEEE